MRRILLITTLMLMAGLIFAASDLAEEKFPDFTLENPDGEQVALSEMIGKRPIVLTFWATWCKPCKKELEKMKPIYKELKDDIYFVTINEDGPRSRSKVKPYFAAEGFEYINVLDDNKDVMMRAGVSDIPEFFLLDLEGNIVYRHRGYKLGNEMKHKKAILDLLKTIPAAGCEDGSETDSEEK